MLFKDVKENISFDENIIEVLDSVDFEDDVNDLSKITDEVKDEVNLVASLCGLLITIIYQEHKRNETEEEDVDDNNNLKESFEEDVLNQDYSVGSKIL